MNSSAASVSSSRERRSRRLAALQHRGRQFQPQTRDPSFAAAANKARGDAATAPSFSTSAAPSIPNFPSPPSSPKSLQRSSSFPTGSSTQHSPPTPPTTSPSSSSWSSSAARPPKVAGGGASSPTPYFSPSRSTDDGDDRPCSGSGGASPPPRTTTSSVAVAALQQPFLSPRFRHVVSPHPSTGGNGISSANPRSPAFRPQFGGRQSPVLALLDDRSVASESDVAHLLRASASAADEAEPPRVVVSSRTSRVGAQALGSPRDSPIKSNAQQQPYHPLAGTAPRTPLSLHPSARSPGPSAGGSDPYHQPHHHLPQLSPRLPLPELRPRLSGSLAPLMPHVVSSAAAASAAYHHPTPRSPNPRHVNLSTHPPGYQGDDEGEDHDDCGESDDAGGGEYGESGDCQRRGGGKTLNPARGAAALRRLAAALRRPGDNARPSGLSPEEAALWEALRAAVAAAPQALPSLPVPGGGADENRLNGPDLSETSGSDPKKPAAIASTSLALERPDAPSPTSVALTAADEPGGAGERTLRALEAELTRRNRRIRDLEHDVAQLQEQQPHSPPGAHMRPTGPPSGSSGEDEEARQDRSHPTTRSPPPKNARAAVDSDAEVERRVQEDAAAARLDELTSELREKSGALENAKMIIASLEIANGSQLSDIRTKLKAKEDELAAVKAELADKQRSLDTLATQLRDVQRSHSYVRYNHMRDEERSRRLGLSSRLEKNMADFRAALVVLESTTVDQEAIEVISNLLSDTIVAMKDGIDMLDEDLDADETSNGGWGGDGSGSSVASAVSSSRGGVAAFSDVRRLHKELDDKSRTMHRLEEALRREREECARLRAERDESDARQEKELEDLRLEMQKLKEQCFTNMEVLTKKERELAVLRDSLKVDDGVGYISDDGTDATESDAEDVPLSPVPHHLGIVTHYGPSQAEALATLLAQSGAPSGAKSVTSNEMQSLKEELLQARTELERSRKQLKTEKESLVNAKMIISSLEKANKSIMDDLRSRLQESNTAITGLLEKSMEHEKTSSKLRKEIESLRQEKECYESELSRFRSNYLDAAPQTSLLLMDMSLVSPLETLTGTMDVPETID